ncbi:MAG: LacI family DNA-binding transcriptional regulator [Fimbriimonadaceae bacterium]|nr:LacI family DNA-binding transcriptional regulator [Fimbriimonadaceae bacterium]
MPVTLKDIARYLNLSHATVSFVLNDRQDVAISPETRKRVIAAAKELGYRPNRAAQALAGGKTQMIALWVPRSNDQLYSNILHCLETHISEAGYDLMYGQIPEGDAASGGNVRNLSWAVDAVIAVDCSYLLEALDAESAFIGRPVVSLGAHPWAGCDSVHVDLYEGAKAALDHLANLGRQDIAYLTTGKGPEDRDPKRGSYVDWCQQKQRSPRLIELPSLTGDEVLQEIRKQLEDRPLPDALLCYCDQLAMAAIRALRDLGKTIPGDCAVMGCNGIEEAAYLNPPLSTIAIPVESMCELAWRFVKDRLEFPELHLQSELLPCDLILRESTDGVD